MATNPTSNSPTGIPAPQMTPEQIKAEGGDTTTSPLGVPKGYQAPYGIQSGSTYFAPGSPMINMFPGSTIGKKLTPYGTTPNDTQYVSGQQWSVPLSDPESIPQLQQQLVQAGLLNPKSIRYGTWDVSSANAYAQVLGFANAYGLNATQALQVLVSNPKASSTKDTFVDPVFTNPNDVQTGFQNISQNLTGQEQDPTAFAQQFHSQEAAAGHEAGASYTQAPSVQGAATQYLNKNNYQDVLDYGVASRQNAFMDLLRQG